MVFATPTEADFLIGQGTPQQKPVSDYWVIVPQDDKLRDFIHFLDEQGAKKLKPVEDIYLQFDANATQYMFKMVQQDAVGSRVCGPFGEAIL